MASTVPSQKANTASPFQVGFLNQFQGEELPILYIVNHEDPTDIAQRIKIIIAAEGDTTYTLKGFGFTPETPAAPQPAPFATVSPTGSKFKPGPDDKFHLGIAVRPGTLSSKTLQAFTSIIQDGLTSSISGNTCVTRGPVIRQSDGALVWYCAFQHDVTIGPMGEVDGITPLMFELQGVSAAAGAGSRGSQIEFLLGQLELGGPDHLFSSKQSIHVDVINHLGHAYAPLYFGVLGKNFLRNNATNDLKIYFETTTSMVKNAAKPETADSERIGIDFGENTTFDFVFSWQDADDPTLMHFAGKSVVEAYDMAPSKDEYSLSHADVHDGRVVSATFNSTGSKPNGAIATLQSRLPILKADSQACVDYFNSSDSPKSILPKIQAAALAVFTKYTNEISNLQNTIGDFYGANGTYVAAMIARDPKLDFAIKFNAQYTVDEFPEAWDNAMAKMEALATGNQQDVQNVVNNTKHFVTDGCGIKSDYDANPWGDNDFVAFVVDYLSSDGPENLIDQCFSHSLSAGHEPLNGRPAVQTAVTGVGVPTVGLPENILIPCRALYELFVILYQIKKAGLVPYIAGAGAQDLAAHLVGQYSIQSEVFLPSQWESHLKNIVDFCQAQKPPIDTNCLNDNTLDVDSGYESGTLWDDPKFVNYLKTDALHLNNTWNNSLLPSRSLYDFFWTEYQLSAINADIADLQKNHPTVPTFKTGVQSYVFEFPALPIDGNEGVVMLDINVRNLPGFWDTSFQVPISIGESIPVGAIIMYAGKAPPSGWLTCDGSEVSSVDYPDLYKVVTGNGELPAQATNFKLPAINDNQTSGTLFLIRH